MAALPGIGFEPWLPPEGRGFRVMWGQDRPILWALALSAALHGAAAAITMAWPWAASQPSGGVVEITWLPGPGGGPPSAPAGAEVSTPALLPPAWKAREGGGKAAPVRRRGKVSAPPVRRAGLPRLAAAVESGARVRLVSAVRGGKRVTPPGEEAQRAGASPGQVVSSRREEGRRSAAGLAPGPSTPLAGSDLRPLCLSCPVPAYPLKARREGWQGKVDVRLRIAVDGRVTKARVAHSSGHLVLDLAALEVARRSRFSISPRRPARGGSILYRFVLRE